MALFQYEGIGSLRSLGNRFTTQRAVYSYSQFSILNYEELSYGSITDAVVEAEDYGEITASIEQYYQIQDFGTITLDTTGVPMGKIGIHLSADDTTTRVSVGGVEFALYGRAITEVFFNPVNRVFDFQGVAVDRTTSSWLGRGVLPPVEAEALDAVVAIPPTSIFHLSTKGSAKTEVIFNKQDRILGFVGEAQVRRSYLYDEVDSIDFASDDFGFLNETVLRTEDYGDVNYIQTNTGHPFTIQPEDLEDESYQSVFFATSIEQGGTGSGSDGGFNIGPHVAFRGLRPDYPPGNNNDRYFEFEADTRLLDQVAFQVIRGNNVNGGEVPDSGEDLYFQYLNEFGTWSTFGFIAYNNTFYNLLRTYTLGIPTQARNWQQRFRVYQDRHTSTTFSFDHWGIRSIQFFESTVGTGFSNEDWGTIDIATTVKAATGRMPFSGSAAESFVKGNYDGSVGNKQPRLVGTAIDYTIPKHQGFGWINIDGTPRVQIRMHYKADGGWDFYPNRFRGGSLFGFADAADATAVLNEGSGKLFTVKSTTTFKAVRSEVGVSEKDILVQGGADYEVIFNQVDRVFSFNNEEINRRAFAYNLSSVVNVESIDYGYITDTITVAEDYGDVSYDEIYYPWQKEDFGTLAPTTTRLPFGLGRLHSSTETPRVRNFVGNQEHTHLRLLGTGKVYVLPKFTSKGDLVKLRGDTTFSRARDWVGTGNLPTVSGTAEAVAFVPAKDDRALFNFEGELVEKFGKGNYDGVGTLFGFDSTSVSIIIGVEVSGLFSVHGEVVEKSVFREVGSGSLGHFDGGAERVTFHYNQFSDFGVCDGDDYGFVSESVYNVEESPALSGYLNDPISSLANEVVSEFGRIPNQIDYGYVNQYYQYNHEDYGTLFPDECLEPQGLQLDFVGNAPESRSFGNYTGSGSIGGISGAAEAIGIRPETISLFAFRGSSPESTTPATEIGSGSLFSYVTFTENVAFVPAKADPLFAIDGGLRVSGVNEQESELKFTAAWAASGSLFGVVGSGEATGNEHTGSGTVFIRNSGLRIAPESFTPWIPAGRGSIFSFVSFTEAAAFVPAKKKALFGFSGAATDVQFSFAYETIQTTHLLVRGTPKIFVLPKHTGTGSFFVRSSGVRIEPESFTPFIPEGSGKLFGGIGGAAEAVGSNPPDDFTLFTFTGEVDTPLLTFSEQKFVQARFLPDEAFTTFQLRVTETGLQPVEVHGELDESFTPAPEITTGSLFGFSSTTEASVFNPIDKTTLFSFEGNAAESETNVEVGSGSFFSFQSATEVTAVAEEKQALFSFAGNLRESVAPAPHVTTGGLFGFSSTTEAKVFDLPERTTLFSVTGTAIESASVAEVVSATQEINGELVERATFAHAGTGSIFGFSSTTEARVIVPRGLRNLFTVTGNSPESETNVEIGSGTLTGFVGGAESTSNVEVKFTLFTIGGDTIGGDVKFTAANLAVGQVRIGLSNDGIPGDISRGITVFRLRTFPEGAKVRFTGTKAESFSPAPHVSEGLVNINRGNEVTEDRYIEFREPQPTRIVVI